MTGSKALCALAVVCAVALWIGAAPASAQSSASGGMSTEDEAHMRFDLGRRYYEAGRFADAAREFEESYRLAPHDELLYNLYLAYRDAGDDAHAAETLRRFLATPIADDRRAQLQARLEVLDQRLAAGTASTSPESSATPTDEGAELTPPTSESEASADAASESEATSNGGGGLGATPWIVLAAGGVIVLGSVVTGALALDARSSLDAMCPTPTTCMDGYADTRSRGQALAIATDVLWAVGGAVVLTGITLAILDATSSHGSSESPQVAVACDGTGCAVSARGSF